MTDVVRSNCFRKDIRLHTKETSFCTAYYKSDMDRGHMAPSGIIFVSIFTYLKTYGCSQLLQMKSCENMLA